VNLHAALTRRPHGSFDLVALANAIPFFDELARRGFVHFATFSVGSETAFLARKGEAS